MKNPLYRTVMRVLVWASEQPGGVTIPFRATAPQLEQLADQVVDGLMLVRDEAHIREIIDADPSKIFVRHRGVDGVLQTVSLDQLQPGERETHISRLVRQWHRPIPDQRPRDDGTYESPEGLA